MIEKISVPIYTGGWIDVFWSDDSRLNVRSEGTTVILEGNMQAFEEISKQLIYYACNNTLDGAHVHYDMFSHGNGFSGISLMLVFSSCNEVVGNNLYDTPIMTTLINIPQHYGSTKKCICPGQLKISCSEEAVVTGDEEAFLFLAKEILSLKTAPASYEPVALYFIPEQQENELTGALLLRLIN